MSKPEVWRYRDYIAHIKRGEDYWGPFELDYIEAYRATGRMIFFDQKWEALHRNRPEKATEHDNVLRLGHLIAHDSHGWEKFEDEKDRAEWLFKNSKLPEGDYWTELLTEEEKEKAWKHFLGKWRVGDIENLPASEHSPGVHFWLRSTDTGNTYTGNVYVKAWLPTDGKTWLKAGDSSPENPTFNSTGDFRPAFGRLVDKEKLEKYKDNKEAYDSDADGIKSYMSLLGVRFQAVYDDDLDLGNVKEINDKELTDGWVSFSEYLKILRKKFIFDMEEIVDEIVVEDDVEQQLNFLNTISNDLRKLQYYLEEMNDQVEEMKEKKGVKYYSRIEDYSSLEENFKNIIRMIEGEGVKGEGYTAVRKRVISEMNEEINYRENRYEKYDEDINIEKLMYNEEKINFVGEFLSNLGNISTKIEKIIEECKEIAEEEKDRAEKQNSAKAEEEFQNKVDLRLTRDILDIPNIRPVAEKVENKI